MHLGACVFRNSTATARLRILQINARASSSTLVKLPGSKRVLMSKQIHFAPPKSNALQFQTEPLLSRGIEAKFDVASRPNDSLPGE
jgi:hypothetical protein